MKEIDYKHLAFSLNFFLSNHRMSKLVKLSPELSNELQQIKSKRKESASNQNKLNDFHEKVSSENGLSEDEKTELIRFYKNAVEISQKEEM